ncbi:hypothetical protein E4U42_001262 [Claviceps africana]|uniref:FAD-binding PCMH-type domain-containing protein n=1 Tax=Claviceps africana TaxID=83212 RepID=A0A8K0J9Z0_9HYPO|nr:hypothetical protein E4U42_001262 [Claviceps africana]
MAESHHVDSVFHQGCPLFRSSQPRIEGQLERQLTERPPSPRSRSCTPASSCSPPAIALRVRSGVDTMRLLRRPGRVLLLLLASSSGILAASPTLDEVESQIRSHLDRHRSSGGPPAMRSGCAIACSFLALARPQQLSWPGSRVYDVEESRYWSQQQQRTLPACRLTPESAADVSLAVLTARVTLCEFAVKSGGHTAFAGASNVHGGLVIDLRALNQVAVSADRRQTSVGAGNLWSDVYNKLSRLGLTVIGGRVSGIGVGGLTLGGGISFFSNRHGWACDNVNGYEVVLADGSIRQVGPESDHSDLYWALRGGGNNFGIVTRFDLATYPQGRLWAGSQTFPFTRETSAAINNAFYHFAVHSASDPYAQVITSYAYSQARKAHVISSALQYGLPTPNPPILSNFTSIPGSFASTLRVTDLPGLTDEFAVLSPKGFRQSMWTLTVGNDAALMSELVAIYKDEVDKLADARGLVASVAFQPISTDMTKHFSRNGGNPLGLAGQGPLVLLNALMSWSDEADDARILPGVRSMMNRFRAAARAKHLDHPFLYQNYASVEQDVFGGYGAANLERLRAVSNKYDPEGVWQRLQPGYFKL